MQLIPSETSEILIPGAVIAGVSQQLRGSLERGAKLVMEVWAVNHENRRGLQFTFVLLGMRTYGEVFNFEIAAMLLPKINIGGGSNDDRKLYLSPAPYMSLMWYL
jgi:hypothetical protein